ncbi:MAG: Flp pilus assembly protein CpaB [Chloroflexi bacterium]|nr:Flp pilus assembly protein CpaB [Chloroflexota bacterium]
MKSNRRILFWALGLGLVSALLAWGILSSKDSVKTGESKSVPVVVATKNIPLRTAITADMVETKKIAASARHVDAVITTDSVVGKVTKQSITAGEQILTTKFFAQRAEEGLAFVVPAGLRAISISISETIGSGGLIVPGDHVDIIGLLRGSDQGAGQGRDKVKGVMVLQNVEVLAVGQEVTGSEAVISNSTTDGTGVKVSSSTGKPQTVPKAKSVTLSVTPDQARHLYLYEELGELRLALRSPNDAGIPQVPAEDLFWDVARSTP